MEEYKFKKIDKKKKDNLKGSYLSRFVNKILVCSILFVLLLIVTKAKPEYKDTIYTKVFENNFSFAKINNLYKKYLGNILPFDKIVPDDEVMVFNEKLTYKSVSLYKDGAKLSVNKSYLVPTIQSGIIVFIGEKENYGKTIIVQQVDGIDVWYGNVEIGSMKLYDYIEKGSLLGSSISEEIYIVFQKEGKFLNYKEYL